ncbi:MAG: hypothetical protein ACU84H_14775 [Gammaproteobacteria bacterium]
MIEPRLKKRFKSLLKEGEEILRQNGWPNPDNYRHPEQVDYVRFRTQSLNLIRLACGENSDHYQELRKIAASKSTSFISYYYRDCYGILQAANNDYESGVLFDIRKFAAAEIIAGFLDQAKCLLENGHHASAASIAGTVLEEGLKKLCSTNAIAVTDPARIGSMNADLSNAEVYSKLVENNISAYSDIRNNADRGDIDKFTKEDIEAMTAWISRFLSEHLG